MSDLKSTTDEKFASEEAKLTALETRMEQYRVRAARIQAQLNQEQRRARAHRLITLGAELERLVGREVSVDELAGLLNLADRPHDPTEHAGSGSGQRGATQTP